MTKIDIKVYIDDMMKIEDTRRLALLVLNIEHLTEMLDNDTLLQLNKVLLKRFVLPVVNYKFFDCPRCQRDCTDADKRDGCIGFLPRKLNKVMLVDEDKNELLALLADILEDVVVVSKRYEAVEKPIDPCLYHLIQTMAKALLSMNGKLDLYMAEMFGKKL